MKKAIALIIALVMMLAVTGCGASAKFSYDTAAVESAPSVNGYYQSTSSYAPAEAPMAAEDAWGGEGKADYATETVTTSQLADTGNTNKNVKLIYRANMSVQTIDFQKTYQSLVDLVNANGGYFESSNVENGSYFSDGTYMYGYYTVRVPSENYAAFVNAVGSSCHVVNLSESVEDVGLEYFEIESRLETLKIKEERLHELLAEAATMTDIIDLENALSDCEYQIDMYKSSLNRYDSLIGYSTININIEKVHVYTPAVQEELTFGERIEKAFNRGAESFRMGCEDFAIWVTENVFDILLVIIIILILWAIHPFRRIRARGERWSEKHQAKKDRKAAKKAGKTAKKGGKKGADYVRTESAAEAGWSQPAFTQEQSSVNVTNLTEGEYTENK